MGFAALETRALLSFLVLQTMLSLRLSRVRVLNSGRMFSGKITQNGTNKRIPITTAVDEPLSYEWKNPHELCAIYTTSFKSITNITLNNSSLFFEEEDTHSLWLLLDEINCTLACGKHDPYLKQQEIEILTEINDFLKQSIPTMSMVNNCIDDICRSMPGRSIVRSYKEYFKTKAEKERAEEVISEEAQNMNLVTFDVETYEYLSVRLIEKLFNASVKLGYNKYGGYLNIHKNVKLIIKDQEFEKKDGAYQVKMLLNLKDVLVDKCNRVFGRGQFGVTFEICSDSTLVVTMKDERQLKDLRNIINSLNDSTSYRYDLCDDN